jgi:hypothetical protein
MNPFIIPEFSLLLILPLSIIATLLAVTICRKKHAKISGLGFAYTKEYVVREENSKA